MDKVGGYGVYQNSFYDRSRAAKEKNVSGNSNVGTAKKTEKKSQVELSESAKKLLKQLQKAYGNMDFIIADYETDEEAAAYLSRGTNQYSVLLTPEELEEMAADEDVKNRNLKALDNAVSKLKDLKDHMGANGQNVSRLGVAIGSDGQVSFFAELEKVNERQRERIEERREEARQAEKKAEKNKTADQRNRGSASASGRESFKRTTVAASSLEELIEKINKVDWDTVSEEFGSGGHHFNFTV